MQVKDDFLHKVLNVTVLGSSNKHHPVVGKPLHGGFLPNLGSVPQLQFHLNGTLAREREREATMSRKAKDRTQL